MIRNASRGVWETTPDGRLVKEKSIEPLWRGYQARLREQRRKRKRVLDAAGADLATDVSDDTDSWREELLQSLLSMSPDGFERLAQRLLRAAGFINSRVTGSSGDGGIDGMGVYRLSLVSFPVYFQCKRYRGSVGPDKVRDFRGAMAGRGDKGLLITTGTFTPDAKREATRDGAPPIDLIDGELLCELLKDHNLGVRTTERTVEDVEVVASFFEELGS
ncbi:MAG TPA: restriction endonuclease [Conexibacter sp.]|nr:restriction endonuclease [Conexibacter sp.]